MKKKEKPLYPPPHYEPHHGDTTSRLNWLRAGVLGANDGIVSVAGVVIGVAGATDDLRTIIIAGVAAIIAGAISMAAGEYVSVSSSRDSELALLSKEKYELRHYPEEELEELTAIYRDRGLSRKTAEQVARELTASNAFKAHIDAELKIDPDNLTNPWHAALASAVSFLIGAVIPLIAVILPPLGIRVPAAVAAVVVALVITGTVSAKIGHASVMRAVIRVVSGGILAMAVTYGIGRLFNVSGL